MNDFLRRHEFLSSFMLVIAMILVIALLGVFSQIFVILVSKMIEIGKTHWAGVTVAVFTTALLIDRSSFITSVLFVSGVILLVIVYAFLCHIFVEILYVTIAILAVHYIGPVIAIVLAAYSLSKLKFVDSEYDIIDL